MGEPRVGGSTWRSPQVSGQPRDDLAGEAREGMTRPAGVFERAPVVPETRFRRATCRVLTPRYSPALGAHRLAPD